MTKPSKKVALPKDSDIGGAVKVVKESDFKQSLVDTLQESNTARTEMKAVLHEILRQPDTIKEIKDIIDKIDRDFIKAFWSKFGFTIWSVVIFILGIIAKEVILRFL